LGEGRGRGGSNIFSIYWKIWFWHIQRILVKNYLNFARFQKIKGFVKIFYLCYVAPSLTKSSWGQPPVWLLFLLVWHYIHRKLSKLKKKIKKLPQKQNLWMKKCGEFLIFLKFWWNEIFWEKKNENIKIDFFFFHFSFFWGCNSFEDLPPLKKYFKIFFSK